MVLSLLQAYLQFSRFNYVLQIRTKALAFLRVGIDLIVDNWSCIIDVFNKNHV